MLTEGRGPPDRRTRTEIELGLRVDTEERAIVRETLERRGYTVLEAPEGHAAVTLAVSYEKSIDVLVTDLVMPGMGGREVARRLVEARPRLRTLFMSGYAGHGAAEREIGARGSEFVQKPFSADEIARTVRRVLDAPLQRVV